MHHKYFQLSSQRYLSHKIIIHFTCQYLREKRYLITYQLYNYFYERSKNVNINKLNLVASFINQEQLCQFNFIFYVS